HARASVALPNVSYCWSILEKERTKSSAKGRRIAMATLVLDLQDGFSDDTVIIHVNGKEVYHKQGVTTNLAISYTDSVQVQVPAGNVIMDIDVASKHLSRTVTFQVTTTLYIGIFILNGSLEVRLSNERFF